MARKPKPKPDDEKQSKRFVETARSLEADKNEGKFNEVIEKIVKPKKSNK